jgi:CubicO group peptidase (beta-lactamase class C family)
MLSQTLIAGVIVGLVAGCSEAPGEKYDFSEVDATVAGFMADYSDVKGVTLAVVRTDEGQIYERGYGDFDADRISLIASLSKVRSAGVILSLVDEGLLDVDRPVSEYLDWGDYHSNVTMQQLVSMMSGIPATVFALCTPSPCHCDPATNIQECARKIFQDESSSVAPGTEFRYGAGTWQLAGAVAEVVSGKTWAELVNERLVAACELSNTGYTNSGATLGYPEGFDGNPANAAQTGNPDLGGGAYTTVSDYGKVLLMHLRGGLCEQERVLSPEMVQLMQEDLVPEDATMFPPVWRREAINYGMGWWKYKDQPGLLIDSGRFGARAILHPEEGWGAIMIIETTTEEGSELRERLVPVIREALGIDQS